MKLDFTPEQIIRVCVLDGSSQSFDAKLLSCAGRYLSMAAQATLKRRTPIRIEWAHYIVLAEVMGKTDEDVFDVLVRHAMTQSDIDHFHNVWV
jgi:hypothetical protein